MALSVSTLASELEALTPTDTPGVAELRLAQAYGAYMRGAAAGAVSIVGAAVDSTAVPAMAAAMAFVAGATESAGSAIVQSGFVAFWAAIVAAPAVFFSGATVVTPPPFASLTAALAAVFVNATQTSASLEQTASDIAAAMHTATVGQGTATLPGPVVSPIA